MLVQRASCTITLLYLSSTYTHPITDQERARGEYMCGACNSFQNYQCIRPRKRRPTDQTHKLYVRRRMFSVICELALMSQCYLVVSIHSKTHYGGFRGIYRQLFQLFFIFCFYQFCHNSRTNIRQTLQQASIVNTVYN